ncbi:MAG: hypothetical protein SV910_08860 [Chloroflexota bacterium]|nr:hypothetical protein [Chloroflexota bacterium]
MAWYMFVSYFFAGVFLANGVPHFVHGISGKKFQSPFASPPAVGESSPLVNVLWGLFNLVLGIELILGVGDFVPHLRVAVLMAGLGAIATSIGLAWYFGRVRQAK